MDVYHSAALLKASIATIELESDAPSKQSTLPQTGAVTEECAPLHPRTKTASLRSLLCSSRGSSRRTGDVKGNASSPESGVDTVEGRALSHMTFARVLGAVSCGMIYFS